MSKKVKVNCTFCGKELERYPSQIKAASSFFCDKFCSGQSRLTLSIVVVQCSGCGATFQRKSNEINKSGRHFCNQSCRKKWLSDNKNTKLTAPSSVLIECSYCGKEKYVPAYRAKQTKNLFCDTKCFRNWIREERDYKGSNNPNYKNVCVETTCSYCGKMTVRHKDLLSINTNTFCSVKCKGLWQSENIFGELHHNYVHRITKVCEICGKEFQLLPRLAERKKFFVCSQECATALQKNKGLLVGENNPNWRGGRWQNCEICGKSKWVLPSRQKRNEDRFCSKECFAIWLRESNSVSLENNPNWRGGLSFEPYPKEFNDELKLAVRERDNFTCQMCGAIENGHSFDCHHIDYNKKNNKISNLVLLCRDLGCHQKTNFGRKYWQYHFQKQLTRLYGYTYRKRNIKNKANSHVCGLLI